ncbi:hypothetical protein ABZY81_10690 [Streptomyces sp. NPDC006514]|uniref:hypothetical protein n=1 Tax=Streptomyces sp. NPDC006514 TaxID=3154308 RepID=UPI0033A886A7
MRLPGGARDRLVEAVGEAMAHFEIGGPRPYSDDLWVWDHWDHGREEFRAFGADRAVVHGNLLTLDGWWCEEGYDPVHGACDDQDACPHTPPYTQRPGAGEAHLAGLPDDTLLVSVRCHV